MQSRLIMALLVVLLPASALAWTVPCHHMPVRAAAPPRAFAPSLKASKKAEIKKLEKQIAKTEKRIVRAKERRRRRARTTSRPRFRTRSVHWASARPL